MKDNEKIPKDPTKEIVDQSVRLFLEGIGLSLMIVALNSFLEKDAGFWWLGLIFIGFITGNILLVGTVRALKKAILLKLHK